ncbi:MAG: hypothetical protein WD025_04685, partial [Bacteriovoracaceae bacterium]
NELFAQSEDFKDFQMVQYKSLFWFLPGTKIPKSAVEIPGNLQERFKELFKIFLEKKIYLSPNGFEIAFVSGAHDEKLQEELRRRLWS